MGPGRRAVAAAGSDHHAARRPALAPSANLLPDGVGLFEPVHGSGPNLAGTDRANPCAAVLRAALVFRHLGHGDAARRLEDAGGAALEADATTPGLCGELGTTAVGDWLVEYLRG